MESFPKQLVVWCVWDRKAGHRSQTKGLVDCLQRKYSVLVRDVSFRSWTRPWGRLMQNLWPLGVTLSDWGMVDRPDNSQEKPDVIVGSGGGVQWAVAALARKHRAFSIYLGSARAIPVNDYGLVLHYVPQMKESGVAILPMMPGSVTRDSADRAWEEWKRKHQLHDGKYATCLVGGDGSGYEWSAADGVKLGALMNQVSAQTGMKWFVSTSRRTPTAMEVALKQTLLPEWIVDSCWAGEGDERRVVAAFLGAAERVLVSEDSMSMMHETLATQKISAVFASQNWRKNDRHEAFLQRAEQERWLTRLNLADANASDSFCVASNHYPDDIQQVVANLLEEKIGWFLASNARD